MQRFVYFVTVFALSVAKDVSVYNPSEYNNRDDPSPVFESAFPWKFGFNSNSRLNMEVRYRNEPLDVTAVSVSYETGEEHIEVPRNVSSYKALSDGLEVFKFEYNLNDTELKINVQIQCKLKIWCASKTVVKTRKSNKEDYKYKDICLKNNPCVLVVDLRNFVCHGPTIVTRKTKSPVTETPTDLENNHNYFGSIVKSPPPENIVTMANNRADETEIAEQQPPPILIYVITPVIVMSVMAMVVYIIVKKHRHRNTHPIDTLDLNIYATPNEVIYADLSLAQGDCKPPRRRDYQESPYAQIIGVMRPIEANFKNK